MENAFTEFLPPYKTLKKLFNYDVNSLVEETIKAHSPCAAAKGMS